MSVRGINLAMSAKDKKFFSANKKEIVKLLRENLIEYVDSGKGTAKDWVNFANGKADAKESSQFSSDFCEMICDELHKKAEELPLVTLFVMFNQLNLTLPANKD